MEIKTNRRSGGINSIFAAMLAVLLCVTATGCSLIENGKELAQNKAEELLLGSAVDQQMLNALADGNFEAMREAVDSGVDMNSLHDLQCPNPLLYLLTAENRAYISTDSFGNLLDLNYAEYLLEQGADPNWADNQGHTLIMHSCGYSGIGYPGGMALMKMLISYGADVNAKDANGYTALDYRVNDVDAATILLDSGAVVTEQTVTLAFHVLQDSPGVEAVFAPKLILDAYMEQGGIPNLPEIILSAAQGNSEAVIEALKVGDIPSEYHAVLGQLIVAFCSIDAVRAAQEQGLFPDNTDGYYGISQYLDITIRANRSDTAELFLKDTELLTALELSVIDNQVDMARYFLDMGALNGFSPKNAQDGFPWEIHDNLLSRAADTGNVELVKLLLDYGYPSNELAISRTLQRAICADSLDIVRYLCEEQAASVTYTYEDDYSPLETAAMRGSLEIAEYLVGHGASIAPEDDCLPNAVMKGHTDMVQFLLAQGAESSGASVDENSAVSAEALAQAVQIGRLDILKLLVEAGADVNEKWGDTPILCVAARGDSVRIVQYLIDHGADINAMDSDGKSALDWSASEEISKVIKAGLA